MELIKLPYFSDEEAEAERGGDLTKVTLKVKAVVVIDPAAVTLLLNSFFFFSCL
jgi:hypothetical protein